MSFEEAIVELLQRNTAVVSNSIYTVKSELHEINKSLQVIAVQLANLKTPEEK